jgi:hypothetical protein
VSPAPLAVDEQLSWARGSGELVIVHLRLPDAILDAGTWVAELVGETGRLSQSAEVTAGPGGVEVDFTVARRALGRSAWLLSIRSGTATRPLRVEARLLAAPGRPVALLPGPTPTTRMRAPAPRARPSWRARVAARLPRPVSTALRRSLGRTLRRRRPGEAGGRP